MATTSVLGDVVSELLGDRAEVVTVMPLGANPHDFRPSARDVASMRDADALVVNGGGLEEGLLDAVDAAERDGVPVYEAIGAVDAVAPDGDGSGAGGRAAGTSGVDPHFFTDPVRMAEAAAGAAEFLRAAVPVLDSSEVAEPVERYLAELRDLDAEVTSILDPVPADRRVLVTDHEAFGPFAQRYDFDVAGTIVPGGATGEASAGELSDLAELVAERGVPAVFVDRSAPAGPARTLAREVGDVEVVGLFAGSLGERGSGGATYLEMIRTNAQRIADALTPS